VQNFYPIIFVNSFSKPIAVETAETLTPAEELAELEFECAEAEREFDAAIAAERANDSVRARLAREKERATEKRNLLWHRRADLLRAQGKIK